MFKPSAAYVNASPNSLGEASSSHFPQQIKYKNACRMPCDMGFLEYGWSDGHNAFEQYFQHNMKEENKSN